MEHSSAMISQKRLFLYRQGLLVLDVYLNSLPATREGHTFNQSGRIAKMNKHMHRVTRRLLISSLRLPWELSMMAVEDLKDFARPLGYHCCMRGSLQPNIIVKLANGALLRIQKILAAVSIGDVYFQGIRLEQDISTSTLLENKRNRPEMLVTYYQSNFTHLHLLHYIAPLSTLRIPHNGPYRPTQWWYILNISRPSRSRHLS